MTPDVFDVFNTLLAILGGSVLGLGLTVWWTRRKTPRED
jgi:hypothetical protein